MPKFGRNDQSVTANSTTTAESTTGAPIGTWTAVKRGKATATDGANAHYGNTSAQSRASIDSNMFNNTTISAFVTGKAVGVFGVSATEANLASGNLAIGIVTYAGSGYAANATCTLTVVNGGTGGVVNAQSNTTGKITALKIQAGGNADYIRPPTVAIAAPTAQTFAANTTAVTGGTPATGANGTIAITAAGFFVANDPVTYTVSAGNTAVAPLVSGTKYYIQFANATVVALSATPGGARLVLVPGGNETGHTLQGDTATGYVDVAGAKNNGVSHAGWNIRTEGSGGRAGRVFHECLVAMGSLGAQTAAYGVAATTNDSSTDNTLLPGT